MDRLPAGVTLYVSFTSTFRRTNSRRRSTLGFLGCLSLRNSTRSVVLRLIALKVSYDLSADLEYNWNCRGSRWTVDADIRGSAAHMLPAHTFSFNAAEKQATLQEHRKDAQRVIAPFVPQISSLSLAARHSYYRHRSPPCNDCLSENKLVFLLMW